MEAWSPQYVDPAFVQSLSRLRARSRVYGLLTAKRTLSLISDAARNGITPEVAAKAAKSKAGDMTIEEAKKILSLRPPITPADIESVRTTACTCLCACVCRAARY